MARRATNRARARRRDSRARRAKIAGVGGVQFPKRRELRYLAEIDARVTAARDLVVELLGECLSQFESEPAEIEAARKDAAGDGEQLDLPLPNVVDLGIIDPADLIRMVDTARLGRARIPPSTRDLLDVAEGVDTFTTDQISKVVETVVGIDPASTPALEDLHRAWAKTNAGLITSIDARFFADISKEVQEAVAIGRSTEQLAAAIEKRTGVARRRAQLIARDQVATLNGQITKARQEAVGVARYEWSTSLDEVVRPEHAAREGKVFDWSEPPPDGHPGEPINCRCVAIPVFDEVEAPAEASAVAEVPAPLTEVAAIVGVPGATPLSVTEAAVKAAAKPRVKAAAAKPKVRKARPPSPAAVAKTANKERIADLIDGGLLKGEDIVRIGGPDGLTFNTKNIKRTKTGFQITESDLSADMIKRGHPGEVTTITVGPTGITTKTKFRERFGDKWESFPVEKDVGAFQIDIV